MKRTVATIICVVMLLCSISVGAQTDFLTDMYTNYTGDYTVSISFESADDVYALLGELQVPEQIENFIDIKAVLKTLLSLDSKMLLQIDMSSDMKKVKLALTADAEQNIDVNRNLNIALSSKMGMWMNMDLSDAGKPIMQIIYSYPYTNKYMVVDALETLPDEEAKADFVKTMSMIFNKEFMTAVNTYSAQVLEKYADIKMSSGKCIIKLDNDALIGMIKEVIPYVFGQMRGLFLTMGADGEEINYILESLEQIPFEKIKLLGDKGITYTYILKNGKISSVDTVADICIDISGIYEAVTGIKWNYMASGTLGFEVKSKVTMSKINTTTVTLPKLTEENSFSLSDMLPKPQIPENMEEMPAYPNWWAGGSAEKLPMIDGVVYVPLRTTLEAAYEDSVEISFENGVITATSEYFPSFKSLKLIVGSDSVYADANEFKTGTVLLENGVTYVSSKLFEELFSWQLSGASYDILTNEYWYEFYTTE